MADIATLDEASLQQVIDSGKPALVLFSNGEGLRTDFNTAFKKSVENKQITIAKIDPTTTSTR